jgi:putative peptidoglycan lipid II flippase
VADALPVSLDSPQPPPLPHGQTADRRVFTTAGAIVMLSLLVKAGTAVRELLIAWYFGTSDPLDAYVIAYAVPYFFITLLGASLAPVLVPAYVGLRVRNQRQGAETLVGDVIVASTLLLVVVAVVLALGAPLYVQLVAQGFSPEKLALAERLAAVLAPTVLTSVLVSLAGGILNAHSRFVVPALSPLISTTVVVCALFVFSASEGVFALAFGLLVGTAIELLLLVILVRREVAPRVSHTMDNPQLFEFGARFVPTLIGALLMASTLLVDQAMSSGLPAGSVAALNYANRLVTAPLGLTAAALGTVVLPHFSRLVSSERWSELRSTIVRYLWKAAVVTIPLALLIVLLARPVTDLLLHRGAFSGTDVQTVSLCLAALAIQIPFYTGVIVLMRLALALKLNVAIALISSAILVLDVGLNAWLASFMGVTGIALSTSIVYACLFGLLLVVTERRLRETNVYVAAAFDSTLTLAAPTVSISIITPTLNAARFLEGCLSSVRAQRYARIEHIVVDGGSTDGTADMARAAPGVVYIEARGSNQSRAINDGLRAARGDVLAWLNADDEYAPGTLHVVQERFAADPTLDVLYGDCDVLDIKYRALWRETPGPYDFTRLLRGGNYIAQPAVFVHRRVFERLGYLDESFECGMDYEFWLRARHAHIEYVPRVLAIFRWHQNSKTARNQFMCWRELLRAARLYGGGWTPALAWSYSRMLVTVGRQRAIRATTTSLRGDSSL